MFFRQIIDNYKQYKSIIKWRKSGNKNYSYRGSICITAFRNPTWIEWAIYCAVVSYRLGLKSVVLFKAKEIEKYYNHSFFNFWEQAKKLSYIEFINIENLPYNKEDYNSYFNINKKSTIASLAYDLKIESQDIIENNDKYEKELLTLRKESAINGAKCFHFFKNNKFRRFICYSGIIEDTAMILAGAKDAGQSVVCVEGWAWRPGHMIYNLNGPALEYNIKGWMNHFGKWNEQKEKEIGRYCGFLDGEIFNDKWLGNFYNVQLSKANSPFPKHISDFLSGENKIFILACNLIGDSSLLNRETIFKSHKDFIIQTVKFFKKNPHLKLIIRAHPGEQWVLGKVKIKLGSFAEEISLGVENILVIDSAEKINTFSLIPFIHCGLVWISSIGVDLVARGIPVIAAAKPKYTKLGIVDEPKSVEDFFDHIKSISQKSMKPTVEQVKAAKEYLYVVFKGFSFEAQGRTFRADSCKLDSMPSQEEHDRFYRILLKLEPAPDRTN
jgi:hypothetical protein